MTKEPGTYSLLLRADVKQTIEVGALGVMEVQPGLYVYVGSALGPGGLRARVQRHVRGDGAQHWHIDYLREATTPMAIWYTHDPVRRECAWATLLRNAAGAHVPHVGFGASDCDCTAHLVAFEDAPAFSAFRKRVRAACPDHDTIARTDPQAVME
jgi:Uri superfamily endonuclease